MHWSYDEVLDLPAEVYAVLVDELKRESAAGKTDPPAFPDPVTWP